MISYALEFKIKKDFAEFLERNENASDFDIVAFRAGYLASLRRFGSGTPSRKPSGELYG